MKYLALALFLILSGPTDPPVAPTIGFFMANWQPKKFTPPPASNATSPAAATATLTIETDSVITRIPLTEYAHNANTWMGRFNQPNLITDISNLHPHIIRWPAGSGSDGYFWNCASGNLPTDVPAMVVDKNGKEKKPGWFYGRPYGNSASLDDYYNMLKQTGSEGLITVNYGYARYGTGSNPVATAAHLAADWVRYDHGRTRYWEIGNENYGDWELGYRIDTTNNKDGQPAFLTGALYGQHFIVFADSMRKAAAEVGATIYIGSVTHESPPRVYEPPTTRNWNAGMMRAIQDKSDYYVVHNYFTPYNQNTSAAAILQLAETVPTGMMNYVRQCMQDNGAEVKPIAMDEWNMFAVGSHQQVSNIGGLFGVIVLGEALKNKYGLAARWDLLNGWAGGNDHGLFSAGDEPGVQRWTPRPAFYYLYYLQAMMGDRLVETRIDGDTTLRAYASTFSSGEMGAAIVNPGVTASTITIATPHPVAGKHYYWYSLQGGDDNGEFSGKVYVNGKGPDGSAGGPADYALVKANMASTQNGIRVTVPARGAVFMVVGK